GELGSWRTRTAPSHQSFSRSFLLPERSTWASTERALRSIGFFLAGGAWAAGLSFSGWGSPPGRRGVSGGAGGGGGGRGAGRGGGWGGRRGAVGRGTRRAAVPCRGRTGRPRGRRPGRWLPRGAAGVPARRRPPPCPSAHLAAACPSTPAPATP